MVLFLPLRAGEKIAIGGFAEKTLKKEKGLKFLFALRIYCACKSNGAWANCSEQVAMQFRNRNFSWNDFHRSFLSATNLVKCPLLRVLISVEIHSMKQLYLRPHYADVVELVDTLDLGSSAAMCVGSSPSIRT